MQLCEQVEATNCGDITLPGFVLSFLMSRTFSSQLADVVMFEAGID